MKHKITQLAELLGEQSRKQVVLAPYTTLKIGGPAELFFEAKTKDQLISAYQYARSLDVPVTVLGGGSNILISDKGIQGLVIKNLSKEIVVRGMKGSYTKGQPTGTVFVEADAGVVFNSFVRWSIEEGYRGIEMHLGLPGTVGGAVYMNSKWTNPPGAVGDCIYQVQLLHQNGEIETVPHDYFRFGYDYSILQKTKEIVLSATFEFQRDLKDRLWDTANRSIAYRRASQPQGVSTPGCTFRNISQSDALSIPTPGHTTSAGYLIDAAGLKGHTIGRAQISTMHANFIVNLGGATAEDVSTLISFVQHSVSEKFHVQLEEEIVRLGEF